MQRIKHFAIGFSIGMSGVIFGCILGLGITLYQKRIEIVFVKNNDRQYVEEQPKIQKL